MTMTTKVCIISIQTVGTATIGGTNPHVVTITNNANTIATTTGNGDQFIEDLSFIASP